MVEGFSNNDQGLGGASTVSGPGGALTTISPDAIQEYRVIDGTPPAEYGQAGGFVTDTVLKSGTNAWHGSLFEYNRIQALAANSWFSNAAGETGSPHPQPVRRIGRRSNNQGQDFLLFHDGIPSSAHLKPDYRQYLYVGFRELREQRRFRRPSWKAIQTARATTRHGSLALIALSVQLSPLRLALVHSARWLPTGLRAMATRHSRLFTPPCAAAQPPVLCSSTAANCVLSAPGGSSYVAEGLWTGPRSGPTQTPITYPVPIYGTVTVPQSTILNQARYTVKMDHKLSAKDQLNGAYLYDNGDLTPPFRWKQHLRTNSRTTPVADRRNHLGAYLHSNGSQPGALLLCAAHRKLPRRPERGRHAIYHHVFRSTDEYDSATPITFPSSSPKTSSSTKTTSRSPTGKHNFKTGGEYRRTRNGSSFDSYKNGVTRHHGHRGSAHGRNV